MPRRKQIEFDSETYLAINDLASDRMATIQELADEAFADVLKKHGRPVGLKAALKQSAAVARANVVSLHSQRLIKKAIRRKSAR
jgi:hypothetical protein